MIVNCPICGSPNTKSFLDRRNVPVHQNLLLKSEREARLAKTGDLRLEICELCGFCFNKSFDGSLLSYGTDYENTQSYSEYFDSYLNGLVDHLLYEKKHDGQKFIEVGCGKGGFLKKLLGKASNNARALGCDPSYLGEDVLHDGRLKFKKEMFHSNSMDKSFDVVICRHVIEHISNPSALISQIRRALNDNLNATVYFETPCVNWILENSVFWDFFYEHCSLFSKDSLSLAFRLNGFEVKKISHVFGGQYLWLEASPCSIKDKTIIDNGTINLANTYLNSEHTYIQDVRERLVTLRKNGRVAVWGAGAKGSTIAHLIDPSNEIICCLVDVNPRKQGLFNAGSGHPIVSPEDLAKYGVTDIVLMNPNYRNEVEGIIASLGLSVRIVG